MKKFIKTLTSLAALVAMVAIAPLASADYSINMHPNDCQTVSIANYTTGQGIDNSCWPLSTVNASVGQVINVVIYYHNSGNAPANNVSFQMTDPTTQTIGSNGTISVTGKILVGGSVVKQGTVTANISGGPAHLVLGNVMRYDRASSANVPVSNGISIFSGSGLAYGTMGTADVDQGAIKASFTVVADNNPCTNCGNNGQAPSVTTNSAQPISNQLGNATLRGWFDSNGYATTTWFQYRLIGNGSWIIVDQQPRGVSSGNIQYTLNNLASGTYEFEAMAQNQYGTTHGGVFTFTISGNNNTNCPANYYWNGSACVQVQNTNCPSGYYWNGSVCVQTQNTNCPSGYYWTGSYCAQNVQNCGYNQYWNGSYCVNNVQTCSYNQYWNGSYCVNNIQTTSLPSVTTLGTISVGGTVAVVDGYYTANGCDAYTHFDYGTSTSFGNQTGEVNKGNNSGSMAQSLSGLSPNTTYYYRAVARNCVGTNYGSTRSFTTSQATTNDTTIVNVVNTTGGGNSLVRLTIDNHRDTVRGNTDIAYDVSWANISGRTLNKLVLEVTFPEQTAVVDTDRGSIERTKNAVIYQIDRLDPRETGDMTIIVRSTGGLKEGDPVVAQAIMAFENPKTSATENAIAYDADTFSVTGSTLGASLFGLGFLPTSLAGWLIIILILLIIIFLARHFMTQNQNKVTVHTAPMPVDPTAGAQTGNDYIVYRPTPKQ